MPYDKQYYEDNKERIRAYQDQYYADNRDRVIAIRRKTYAKNRQQRLDGAAEYAQRVRHEAKVFLGGKCVRCGFDDFRALQIDHIDGGGTKELRKLGSPGVARKVLRGEPGYQLLCANCNWIKRVENNEVITRNFFAT